MLPDDFQWRPSLGGEALYFGPRQLATLTALDGGNCRVNTRPDRIGERYAFFATYDVGRRYIEAWAAKWEAEIRAEGQDQSTLYGRGTMQVPPPGTVETTHRRRARHRR